ncbi:uncharacterized protein LOC120318592 isoform X2 [Crotalus tigris]|uniref:uncharacterized protein LOC120318592 isoform X2 n=1 Tax=Crotalus tigris TaxID=88082 RepID=UPI00192F538B|nr:uncharacterized protein LOC120318592 isoform X2 [Crotalus tigris]
MACPGAKSIKGTEDKDGRPSLSGARGELSCLGGYGGNEAHRARRTAKPRRVPGRILGARRRRLPAPLVTFLRKGRRLRGTRPGKSTCSTIPGEMAKALKAEDKKFESALCRSHQASAWAVKASTSLAFFARVSIMWLRELQDLVPPDQVLIPGSRRDGCPPQSLAQEAVVRLSSPPPDLGNSPQDSARMGGGHPDCFTLAEVSVFRRPGGAFHLSPVDSYRLYRPQPGSSSASRSPVAPTNLAFERRALTRNSYSLRMIAMIPQSRRPSMNRIYDATWRSFCAWCSGHRVELSDITIPVVLEFLMDGLDKGLPADKFQPFPR